MQLRVGKGRPKLPPNIQIRDDSFIQLPTGEGEPPTPPTMKMVVGVSFSNAELQEIAYCQEHQDEFNHDAEYNILLMIAKLADLLQANGIDLDKAKPDAQL